MQSRAIEVPDAIREHWLRSKGAYQGLFEGKDFTIEFHLGEVETAVLSMGIDVRGSGDPMPVIQRLMKIEGSKITDLRGNTPTTKLWRSFGTWRDDTIEQIKDEGA